MAEINIDATNAILGRLGSFTAKHALLGNTVNIFNCEKAIITGLPSITRERYYKRMFDLGRPQKGPFATRMPDRFVRRSIRNMVGYKTSRGEAAFDRIMCYIGVPTKFKDKKLSKVSKQVSEVPSLRFQTVGDLCVSLGGKV